MESSSALMVVSGALALGGTGEDTGSFSDAPQLEQKDIRPSVATPQLLQKRVPCDPPGDGGGVAPADGGLYPVVGGRRRISNKRMITKINSTAPPAMATIAHQGNPPPSVVGRGEVVGVGLGEVVGVGLGEVVGVGLGEVVGVGLGEVVGVGRGEEVGVGGGETVLLTAKEIPVKLVLWKTTV